MLLNSYMFLDDWSHTPSERKRILCSVIDKVLHFESVLPVRIITMTPETDGKWCMIDTSVRAVMCSTWPSKISVIII